MSETLAMLDRVLAAVELLAANRKTEVVELQTLLGLELARKAEPGNPFFEVHLGRFEQRPPFRALEIRRPLQRPWTRGLFILDLHPIAGLGWPQIEGRLGPPARVTMPRPQEPRDMPLSLGWQKPWGWMSLGVSRTQPQALVRAILDWKD
jgi:hypothetical protein